MRGARRGPGAVPGREARAKGGDAGAGRDASRHAGAAGTGRPAVVSPWQPGRAGCDARACGWEVGWGGGGESGVGEGRRPGGGRTGLGRVGRTGGQAAALSGAGGAVRGGDAGVETQVEGGALAETPGRISARRSGPRTRMRRVTRRLRRGSADAPATPKLKRSGRRGGERRMRGRGAAEEGGLSHVSSHMMTRGCLLFEKREKMRHLEPCIKPPSCGGLMDGHEGGLIDGSSHVFEYMACSHLSSQSGAESPLCGRSRAGIAAPVCRGGRAPELLQI